MRTVRGLGTRIPRNISLHPGFHHGPRDRQNLAVALYPLFDRLAERVSPRAAAALITLLLLMIVIGPVKWLGFGIISGIETIVAELNAGELAVPVPPDSVRTWPPIGARVHELCILAATVALFEHTERKRRRVRCWG